MPELNVIKEKQEVEEELEEILEGLKTRIMVIGCGGGGSNTVERMSEETIVGSNLIALNTDAQHLLQVKVDKKFFIGRRKYKGLGAGSFPEIGEEAARESEDELRDLVSGNDMVFITCGLGGGTGTGASPVIAKLAKDAGALTISVVTTPFSAEGKTRMDNAEIGLRNLREVSDTVIVVPNDKLLDVAPQLPLHEAFKVADDVLMRAVKGITELITKPGMINLDFADVRAVMEDGDVAMLGLGEGHGEDRAMDSVRRALRSPLLDVDISSATAALINVTGGEDMTVAESESIVKEIYGKINTSARVIWGAQIDPQLDEVMRTMIILVGVRSPQVLGKPKKEPRKVHGIDMVS